MRYRDRFHTKYQTLIDDEMWNFIEETAKWYPDDAVEKSIAEQRSVYDAMCRAFHQGYPAGVQSEDRMFPYRDDGTAEDLSFNFRIYRSDKSNPARACVIYLHGGGFVVGGLESHDDICAEICAATGLAVISVDYALAPEHQFPDDFNQCLAILKAVGDGAFFDATKLPCVVVGDSAGGNLAAALCHAARGTQYAPIGQVLIYPGLSSSLAGTSFTEHAKAPMLTADEVAYYWQVRTGGREALAGNALCFPLCEEDYSLLPPTFVFSAECDPLCSDGKVYCDAVNAAGGTAKWTNGQGLVHGYLRARHGAERAAGSFRQMVLAIETLASNGLIAFEKKADGP